MLLNTSLLRERFVIRRPHNDDELFVACGNRLALPLVSRNGEIKEKLIVRAHSMHMALRMAAIISREFYKNGPVANRMTPLPWGDIWYDLCSLYERVHTPQTWVAVYNNKGRILFQDGKHHAFLDVIEQCDVRNRAEYDRAIGIAEESFKQAGKEVLINHIVNIGVVIGAMEGRIQTGLILRSPSHNSTFNVKMEERPDTDSHLMPHHGLELASYYLEGIQLAVQTGMYGPKDSTTRYPETVYKRIGQINQSITLSEKMFKIRYRPERPDFRELLEAAKDYVVED